MRIRNNTTCFVFCTFVINTWSHLFTNLLSSSQNVYMWTYCMAVNNGIELQHASTIIHISRFSNLANCDPKGHKRETDLAIVIIAWRIYKHIITHFIFHSRALCVSGEIISNYIRMDGLPTSTCPRHLMRVMRCLCCVVCIIIQCWFLIIIVEPLGAVDDQVWLLAAMSYIYSHGIFWALCHKR